MPIWDPTRYLQFADDRSRPFVDLVARIDGDPRTIVDLGCGPGHLTGVLQQRWPLATVHGIDSSPEMVERAIAGAGGAATYELADVATWSPEGPADLIVSNALFQWVPDQLQVIEGLTEHVAPRGTFALQVPRNYDAPSHTLLRDLAAQEPYERFTAGIVADRGTEPSKYLDLFAGLGWQIDVWETTYSHVLQGPDPVFDWVSGTGARPYFQALDAELGERLAEEFRTALRASYPARPWGTIFPFRRTFVVARRPA